MRIVNPIHPNTVSPMEMKDGQIGVIRKWGVYREYSGRVVQKYGQALICLGFDSTCSWGDPARFIQEPSNFQIEILPKGTQLEI